MKTLAELLKLASTPEGKQKINNQVADACGVERMTTGWVPSYNDPDNIGCHPMAEPIDIPDYASILDAIMPEVRKMGDELWGHYIDHLEAACGIDGWHIMGLNERWGIVTATPIHHCIALILTLQKP